MKKKKKRLKRINIHFIFYLIRLRSFFLKRMAFFSLVVFSFFLLIAVIPSSLESRESRPSRLSLKASSFQSPPSSKHESSVYKELSRRIDLLVSRSKIPKKALGLMMTHSEGFQYTLNQNKLFNPASLVKIIVAKACLSLFPLDHRFKTKIFIDERKKKKNKEGFYILDGNLYLKGGGDPSFTSESLWNLVNRFQREKIVKINGEIIVDASLFDRKMYDGRRKIRVESSYDAPIEALSFNWNTVNIFVRPSTQVNQPALVFVDPLNHYIKVINRSRTKRGMKNKIQVRRMKNLYIPGDSIHIKGSIGVRAQEKVFYRNVTEPALWTGYNLKSFLRQRKIEVLGTVKRGVLRDGLKLVSTQESPPLKKIISDMMKFSNNFVAEMLTKNLSLQRDEEGLQGNIEKGLLKIKKLLKDLSISEKNYVLLSPSGLSEKNRFRVQDLHKILEIVKGDFRMFPDFLTAFPSNAVDGTLKSRMNDEPNLKAWIRAKTGTLNHVAGLSGYIGIKNGSPFIFTFLFNAPTQHRSLKARRMRDKAEALFDQMAKLLLDFSNEFSFSKSPFFNDQAKYKKK